MNNNLRTILKTMLLIFLLVQTSRFLYPEDPYHLIQLGILPPARTFTAQNNQHNSLAIGILYQHHSRISGVAISPGNIITKSSRGILLGLYNQVDGPSVGLNLGIASVYHSFYGMSINMANLNYGSLGVGIQLGAINLNSDKYQGLQIGGLNAQLTFYGIQAGLVNLSRTTIGWQSALFNRSKKLYGFQLGLINLVDEGKGAQLGLFNLVKNDSIVPFGLVTIVQNQPLFFEIDVDSANHINFSLKHGSRYIYNIYTVSKRISLDHWYLGWGWGFQTLPALLRWHLESSVYIDPVLISTHSHLRWRTQTFFKIQAAKRLGILIGFYFDVFYVFDKQSADFKVQVPGNLTDKGSYSTITTPGVFVGWQF